MRFLICYAALSRALASAHALIHIQMILLSILKRVPGKLYVISLNSLAVTIRRKKKMVLANVSDVSQKGCEHFH